MRARVIKRLVVNSPADISQCCGRQAGGGALSGREMGHTKRGERERRRRHSVSHKFPQHCIDWLSRKPLVLGGRC